MILPAAFLLLAAAFPVPGPDVPPTVATEVERLLTVLGHSDCRFERNGAWHAAAEAESHLRNKYEHLARKRLVKSTEDFIAGAGERSSLSGRPYQVECPGQAAQPSGTWLRERLYEMRRARQAAAP